MSVVAERLNNLTPEVASALPPAELYKIVEAAVLDELGPEANTVSAAVLHAIVYETVTVWPNCPVSIRNSEWFQPRPSSGETLTDFFRRNTHLFSDDFVRRNQHLLASSSQTPSSPAVSSANPVSQEEGLLDSPTSPPASRPEESLASPTSPPPAVSSSDESTDVDEDNVETDSFTADSSFDTEPFIDAVGVDELVAASETDARELLQQGLAVLRQENPAFQ